MSKTLKRPLGLSESEYEDSYYRRILKEDLINSAYKLTDGRKYFVIYEEWEGSELDLSIILDDKSVITSSFLSVSTKCHHAWLLILLLDASEADVGEYVLFDASMTSMYSPYRVRLSDSSFDSLFEYIGRLSNGSVWRRGG